MTVAGLSTAVYKAVDRIPRSHRAPSVTMDVPANGRDRLEVAARLGSDQFAEVTFLAKVGHGGWQDIGTDDNAPYRVFHDVADVAPGTSVQYRAVVLDNGGHTRSSTVARSTVSPPSIALEAPNDGQRVRGTADVRATAVPDHATYGMTFQRSVDGGAFTNIGTDASSPVYTVFDDVSALPTARTSATGPCSPDAPGKTVTSETRTVDVQRRGDARDDPLQRPTPPTAVGPPPLRRRPRPRRGHRRLDQPDAVRGQRRLRRAGHDPGSPTTPSASASSSTSCRRTRHQGHRERPVLHPARHPGDLAAAGRRPDLQLRGGGRHLRYSVRVGGVGSNRGRPPHRGSGRHREQGRSTMSRPSAGRRARRCRDSAVQHSVRRRIRLPRTRFSASPTTHSLSTSARTRAAVIRTASGRRPSGRPAGRSAGGRSSSARAGRRRRSSTPLPTLRSYGLDVSTRTYGVYSVAPGRHQRRR